MRARLRNRSMIVRGVLLGLFTAVWLVGLLAGPALGETRVSTFAGTAGLPGWTNANRGAARFDYPFDAEFGPSGVLYVADRDNHTIRAINALGTVTTLAGKPGIVGSTNGTGSTARFDTPWDIAVSDSGTIFVADTNNHTIRKITPAGVVTLVAGQPGVSGFADGTGAAARFYHPCAIAVDSHDNLYVADYYNHTIRKITPAGVVTTIAGKPAASGNADGIGTAARFLYPKGITVNDAGVVYVTDSNNSTIRQLVNVGATWVVTTIAGTPGSSGHDDGVGAAARFFVPWSISADASGALYVAEFPNHTIRKMVKRTPAEGGGWLVSTVAGKPTVPGSADGATNLARFRAPRGIAVHPSGALSVADTENSTIRRIVTRPTYATLVGSDRYETAILVSQDAYPSGASIVFVVKGDDFPDALAAAPLAAAYDGPVILTPSWGLPSSVRDELIRLNPGKIFFIGLSDTLKPAIQAAAPGASIQTVRGVNRYHTATLIAEELRAKRGTIPWVVLTPGDKFPDALSVAPLAANKGWAILLTPAAGPLPAMTSAKITSLGVTKALVVGTYVDPPASVTTVVRKVGTDRYHTSALIAAYSTGRGLSFAHTAVATGENFPDALVAGAYLADDKGILVLTHPTTLPNPIRNQLFANRDYIERMDFPGLPAGIIAVIKGVVED
ncbi:MAG: cell wall-binding repeat-containing protein [Actinobacteria bacterium]|nr:cell wall-binding repeat-containing protein [Actinomycetota bacterium]